ncbi:MAG TPA: peptide chain release factor N(5)-glutamine methyltransferase [Dongiaceae bacterium]|jgi:release factor glutamine methyltransferase
MRRPSAYARNPGHDSVGAMLRRATDRLGKGGISRPQAEARLLLAAATGLSRASIIGFPERTLAQDQSSEMERLVARRVQREPISKILGSREFWSLNFRVTGDTLDPRPDSETLIEAVLARIDDRNLPLRILDFGTGTGCLLLALLSELPNAQGVGVDISEAALAVARSNAEALGFSQRAHFTIGDWGRDIKSDQFDVIISNPPYIETSALKELEPEVAEHDPKLALDGGEDGLDAYRRLTPDAARLLKTGGLLALEIGQDQGEAVCRILREAGLEEAGSAADLAGIERCLMFRHGTKIGSSGT